MTLDLPVLSALLVALLIGFVLGRVTARERSDPSDFNRPRRQGKMRQMMMAPSSPARERSDPSDFNRLHRQGKMRQMMMAPSSPAASFDDASLIMPPEVHLHLQNGALINAIKALKDANPGMGLKQAKDTVEAYARRNGLN